MPNQREIQQSIDEEEEEESDEDYDNEEEEQQNDASPHARSPEPFSAILNEMENNPAMNDSNREMNSSLLFLNPVRINQ